ncbi:tetratricopeptide (TPR) repeat protein [Neisseria sp. HSC-16F19]|nr:hypothetical protein [Neisseria sp. HSC-16F19]MCP2040606.1 tetratricopeptide (TPR) repeat protein [Neisseria sp. HSC-16F19]
METTYLLIPLLVGLLAVLFVVNKKQKQKQSGQAAAPAAKTARKSAQAAGAATGKAAAAPAASEAPAEQPAPALDVGDDIGWDVAPESSTVSVETVDALTEYKVYKQFGYHQKAAESLAQYLQTHSTSDSMRGTLAVELAGLWLQAKQPDELAEVLTQYRDVISKDDAEQLIKDGLGLDSNHLALRVLAEELLGWGVQETAQELGLNQNDAMPVAAKQDVFTPEAAAEQQAKAEEQAQLARRRDLVSGDEQQWKIDQDERDVLLGFAKPEQGYQLLKDQLVYDAAVRCLNKAIQQSDKPAGLIIDALSLDYRNNKLGVFAQHLWRLYYSLGQHGNRVKERMLGWGYNLGNHPMFEELERKPNEQRLREIGMNQGYITRGSSAMKAKRKSLVESVASESFVAQNPAERILSDAESLLTYGQLDHAMELLETSIFEHPQESQLYIALFDLYERLEDWPRLENILHKIRDAVKTPPEEVVLAMSQLLQRINHGGVQQ